MDGAVVAAGSVGSGGSLALRLGQATFSSAALLFTSVGGQFYNFTAFCFLVTIMGLLIPWSFTLALVDMYSICARCPPRIPGVMVIVVVGDLVLSVLSLAAACATIGVVDVIVNFGNICVQKICSRYQLSAAMAFISWVLTATSALCNLWLVASF